MPQYTTGLELILNACEGCLQIAITDDEQPLAFEEWFKPQNGAEILTPALQEMCNHLKINLKDFRRIACFAGPGSFTGIRIVLSTAAAIRRVTSAQLASLDYLQGLATTAAMNRGLLFPINILVLTHAKRNQVHSCRFISYGPQIPAQPAGMTSLEDPAKAIPDTPPDPLFICGSGLNRHPEIMETDNPALVFMPEITRPSMQAICLLARHGDYFPKDVEPRYIRPCDAVENLEEIAQKNGLDPQEARSTLDELLNASPEGR